jgi:hypothetical protein
MVLEQFNEPLTNLYSKTQQNSVTKLFSGIILGLLLFFAIVVFALGLELILDTSEWIQVFVHDLQALGIVAGFLLTLEVWGLIPHVTKDIKEA